MGLARFLPELWRQAPSKRVLLRSLALGNKGGNLAVSSPDGTSLSVRRSGQGPPVVLVHGMLDGMNAFSLVEIPLAERYEVWAYDRRGRGGSTDAGAYSLDREVNDLRAIIEATGSPAHVVAHSYGAVVALCAALDTVPIQSLTVYEPPLNGDAIETNHIANVRKLVNDDHYDEAIAFLAQEVAGISSDEAAIAMAIPPVRKQLRDGVRTAAREMEAVRSCDWSRLPIAGPPTLILHGERSTAPVYPTEDQFAEIAHEAETSTLRDQGHLAQTFAPAAFTEQVLSFLGRH